MRWTMSWLAAAAASVAAAVAVAGPAEAASPADRPFTVGNYPVEARAKDAATAKEKAIAEGQQAAFRSLLKRLVPVSAYNRLACRLNRAGTDWQNTSDAALLAAICATLPPDRRGQAAAKGLRAADLVEGYTVRSERNSSTDYVASLDFTFSPAGVRRFMQTHGLPFLDEQAPPVVLVPVYRAPPAAQGATVPAAMTQVRGQKTWADVWAGLDVQNALTPITLKPLKAEIHADTIAAVVSGDESGHRVIAGEYQAERVLIAVVEPDPAGRRLNVTLAGTDAVGPFTLKRSFRMQTDFAYTAEFAAVLSFAVLEGRWKSVKVRTRGRPQLSSSTLEIAPVRLTVTFATLPQWQQVRERIERTPGVEDLRDEGFAPRVASLSMRFPGGAEALSRALAEQGLIMRQTGGAWTLYAN